MLSSSCINIKNLLQHILRHHFKAASSEELEKKKKKVEKLDLISPARELTHIRGAQKVFEVGKWPRQERRRSWRWGAGPSASALPGQRLWNAAAAAAALPGTSRLRPSSARRRAAFEQRQEPRVGVVLELAAVPGRALISSCEIWSLSRSPRWSQMTEIQRNLNAGSSGEETAVLSCYPNFLKLSLIFIESLVCFFFYLVI